MAIFNQICVAVPRKCPSCLSKQWRRLEVDEKGDPIPEYKNGAEYAVFVCKDCGYKEAFNGRLI